MHRPWFCLVVAATLTATGCGRLGGLIMGEVEADVDGHHVVVTDCYRTSPPAPKRLPDDNGLPVFEYAACRDAIVKLRGAELLVNGTSYGALGTGDDVLVDHGKVSIKRKPVARRQPGSG